MDTSNISNLPSRDNHACQWVDLDGEGAPGILEQRTDGTWVFRRNENSTVEHGSGPQFEQNVTVMSRPNHRLGNSAYFEDLD